MRGERRQGLAALLVLSMLLASGTAAAQDADSPTEAAPETPSPYAATPAEEAAEEELDFGEKAGRAIAAYLPNRFLDLFDVFRLRVRMGPGFSSSARLTRLVSGTVGEYSSFYIGLPGARGEPTFLSPIGLEHFGDDLNPRPLPGSVEPYYGPGEVGAGTPFGFFGFDLGVDPVEALDFAAGFLFIDFLEDDF